MIKRNTVAVVTDGTAVLGAGTSGPRQRCPSEGKAMLFKEPADVDAFLDLARHQGRRRDRPHGQARSRPRVRRHQPRGHLGAALLRDRAAPGPRPPHTGLPRRPARDGDRRPRGAHERCKLTGRERRDLRVLVTGLGAAGVAVTRILIDAGVRRSWSRRLARRGQHRARGLRRRDDERGEDAGTRRSRIRAPDRPAGRRHRGDRPLHRAVRAGRHAGRGAGPRNPDPMVFAMANPTPEVSPRRPPRT